MAHNPFEEIARHFFEDYNEKKQLINLQKDPDLLTYMYDEMYKADVKYDKQTKEAYEIIGRSFNELIE